MVKISEYFYQTGDFKMRIISSCLAALILAMTPVFAEAAKKDDSKYDRPYDKFFEAPMMWSPVLSPDGTHMAMARRDKDENHFIIIQNLVDPGAQPTGINLGDELEVQWVEWGNDNRVLYSVLKPWDGGLMSRPVVRMFGIDKDGKNNSQYFRNNKRINENIFIGRPVSFLPNDPKHIMLPIRLGDDLDILKVNVDSGKFTLGAKGESNTVAWYTDIDGNAAFYRTIRSNGSISDYYSRIPGTNGKDAKFKLAKTVRRDTTSNSTNLDFVPIGPAKNRNHYYVIARPDGANFAGVHLYDFEQDKYLQEVFVPDNADVITALVDERTGTFEGAIYREKGRVKYAMSDKKTQAHMNALESYFGDSVVPTLQSVSADRNMMMFIATGPGKPGSYHLYDKNAAFAEEIGARMPDITAAPYGVGQIIEYKSRDGLELYGYLTQPTNVKPGTKAPLIVMPHGGPEARSDFGYNTVVQMLNWKGYQVFEPNFRGSTGRGLAFADKGRRQWGKAMQNDVDDGFNHLVAQGIAEQDKACIMGFSYGGYSALAAATLTPNKYQCVIAGAAPADLFEMLRYAKSEGEFGYNYWTRHIGHMEDDAAEIVQISPAQLASRIEDPVLVHHGVRDTIVPFNQGEIMVDAMQKAGKDVTWIKMNQTGHWYPQEKDDVRNDFYDGLFAFLDKHLPVR